MSTVLDIEQIEWIAVADELPDVDTTVLVHAPGSDEPVWLGYFDGEDWLEIGGAMYSNEEELADCVTAWAPIPTGPSKEPRTC
jgi:hypothetical protein